MKANNRIYSPPPRGPEHFRRYWTNEYGSFSDIRVILSDDGRDFHVDTTMRAKLSDGTERIKTANRWIHINEYPAFIADLCARVGPENFYEFTR